MKYSPVANALKLIGGKWKIMILDSLLSKHMRFGELKRSLNGITSQMLSKQLKDMERDKLLIKKISKVETLNTEYSLTEFGKSTVPIVKSLIKWGTFNKKKITIIDYGSGNILSAKQSFARVIKKEFLASVFWGI